jgi:diguanylate cyclase (GGDEF)-like protein
LATILAFDGLARERGLTASLERRDHRLIEAAVGEDALQVVRAEKPDVILAGILSPDSGGLQLLQHLSAVPDVVPAPRVVFVSESWLESEARALAHACGAAGFLTTPANPEALLAAIDEALSAPRPPAADPGVVGTRLRELTNRLYLRATEFDRLAARLNKRAADLAEQLEVARAALAQEVTKRLWAEQELTQANLGLRDKALRDALTGLYNRGYLEDSLEREASRARRSAQPFGVMMIDIDHFKRCNDRFGHAAGDAVLRAAGDYLLSLARAEDIPCRYGGDEFVLVMAHAAPATVRERAEKLRLGVQEIGVEYEGAPIGPVTLSIGIATFPDHGETGQAVLQAADAALYRAKQEGRNNIAVARQERGTAAPAGRTGSARGLE